MRRQLLFTCKYIATLLTNALVTNNCVFDHLITAVSNINTAACQGTGARKTVACYILDVTEKHRTHFNFKHFTAHRERNHTRLLAHMSVRLHVPLLKMSREAKVLTLIWAVTYPLC